MTHRQSPSDGPAPHAEARRALDVYGADPTRWPEGMRPLFDAALGDPAFEAERAAAAALDVALEEARAPQAGAALERAILETYDIAPRAGGGFLSPLGLRGGGLRRFVPAGALAGLSALGFVVGAATAGAGSALADEFLLYSEASLAVAYDEGDPFWAEE